MSARDIHFGEVHGHDENFFFFGAGFGEDFARSSGNETLAPEFDAVAREAFIANAIGDSDIAAIGNGMRALDGFPGGVLAFALRIFFVGMPADGGGIEEDFGT